ncbi:MAG: hypothetical protein WBV71_12300 [Roseobacter sp.]
MTDHKIPQETDLDVLFAQARAQDSTVPPDLMHRVMLDAQAAQTSSQAAKGHQGRWGRARLREHFAGWSVFGGLAAASCVGFWIGFNPPDVLDVFTLPVSPTWADTLGGEAAELSGFGWDLEEADT